MSIWPARALQLQGGLRAAGDSVVSTELLLPLRQRCGDIRAGREPRSEFQDIRCRPAGGKRSADKESTAGLFLVENNDDWDGMESVCWEE